MNLPFPIQHALEKILEDVEIESLKEASQALTANYKTSGFLKDKKERLAYLITRLPATYEAIWSVFEKIPFKIESFLDLGSGPGTALFAAQEIWGKDIKCSCLEKDPYFIELSKKLGTKALWIENDIRMIDKFEPHDLVCFGYSYGEILDEISLKKSWDAAKKALVIVEPGTPKGYRNVIQARDALIRWGGNILAPCPHIQKCPLIESDWCHFSARVERSFLHRKLKEAELPYEDEKYSYVVFTKEKSSPQKARVLREPLKKTGHVHLFLCCPDGAARHVIVSKRNKEAYKKSRKIAWGNLFDAP